MPKPTTLYNGKVYATKTDMCWALFFDTLNIRFDYIPATQEYVLKPLAPLFWLYDFKAFYRGRTVEPTDKDDKDSLMLVGDHEVFMAWGPLDDVWIARYWRGSNGRRYRKDTYAWFECSCCHKVQLVDYYNAGCTCEERQQARYLPHIIEETNSDRLCEAYASAHKLRVQQV